MRYIKTIGRESHINSLGVCILKDKKT